MIILLKWCFCEIFIKRERFEYQSMFKLSSLALPINKFLYSTFAERLCYNRNYSFKTPLFQAAIVIVFAERFLFNGNNYSFKKLFSHQWAFCVVKFFI